MEYQQVSSATSFPRKVAYGHGHSHSHSRSFSGKTIYDGVFAVRASKKTSVVEDYSEIFGGSGSSIPVLDVPELNEGKLRVDVGSSKLDYAKVFGGFEEFDFAQSHEELLANPKKRETSSFEEARDHTGTGFLSEVSSSKVTVDSPVSADSAHEASQRPVDSVKPLKISYDKTNHGNKNGTNAAVHTARHQAVPGNTHISDGVSPLQMAKGNQAVSVAKNNECGPGLTEGKHFKKAKAELPSCPDDVSKTSRNGIEIQKKSCQIGCNLNDRIPDTYEIGLGTYHSKMSQSSSLPRELGKNKDSGRSVVSKLRAYKSYSAEDTAGIYSSPYSDEEVDANSAAAASAAAVKKAIEEAQARIKIAKEIMERKKEGLQNRVKPSFNDGLKTQHRGEGKITGKASKSGKKKAQDIFEKVDTKQIVSGIGDPDRKKAGKLALEDRGWAKLSFATEAQSKTLGKNFQSTQGDHRLEEVGTWEAAEQGEYNKKMQFVKEYEWKEKNVASEKVEEYIKNMKAIEDAVILEEVEGKHNAVEGAGDSPDCPHKLKSADEVLDWEEIEKKSRVAHQREEIEKKFQVSFESEQCERKLEEIQEAREDEGKPETQGLADNENVRILQDAEEGTEKDEKQKELLEQKQNNTRSESVYKRNDTEMRFDESASEKEFGKSHHKAYDVVDFWEEHEEAGKLKENEELKEFYSDGNIERRSTEDQELETIEVRVDNFHENEENDYGLEIDGGLGRIENLIQAKDNFTILKESYLMGEFENRDQETCEWIETGKIQAEIGQEAEDERNEAIKGTPRSCRNDTDAYTDACMQDEDETLEACNHEGNSECLELSPEVLECGGKGVLVDVTETSSICKLIREELIGVEVVNDQEEKKVIETVGLGQDATELNEIKERVEDTTDCPAFEKNEMNLGTSDMDFEQHEEEYEMVCNMGKHVEELACEYKENNGDSKESKSTDKQEQDENNPISFEERCVDNGMEAARLPGMFEREGETMESTDNIETSQSTEDTEENQFETLTKVEVEAKDALQKEVKLETEHVNKIDEAKDRAREREKERIVVERAIREARERAFAEARERAALDRANGGGHRRVTAEARGRSEKTSTEVNDKSSAEKASMEAKLKAERAAVERATAEARERALERALSEKAAFEARNQAEKFSRDNGMKQRFPSFDPLYKGSAPSKSSKFPNSSNHSVPPSTERFDGANVESAERCKARLERHQRTTERAAKALAEKNMRDLLVQKEQAEKNRLAETLDADVKRWSSGKEGNLRALLSTLQYILGSDSGWQPIPLTDLITTGAVKKAYRKATLCVHPDKLQQRGASIQQKYTCEKVFDLLKEAWNKFSVEER